MAQWLINFTKEAENDVSLLDRNVGARVLEKIGWLRDNFEGDWRVIYEIDYFDNKITIHCIDHRSKVYNKPPK